VTEIQISKARILICTTCEGERSRSAESDALREALERAGLANRITFEFGGCVGACAEPVAIGLQGEGLASYVFSGLDLHEDADDIAATCQAYLAARKGWIVDAHPCGRLRDCLRARLPALS